MEPRTTPAPEPLPGLTVVVPALDEEEGLPLTLRALFEALAALGRASEVIVVDDGSTDRTATIAREMGARVVAHPQPAGYGAALKTGIRLARHPLVAIVDADAAYPVDQLPAMVAQMDRYDMVVAARSGRHYRRRALLSPMRSAFLLLTNVVAGTWIPDPNSGLRVFRRDVALPMSQALDVLYPPDAWPFARLDLGEVLPCIALRHQRRTGHQMVTPERVAQARREPSGTFYETIGFTHSLGDGEAVAFTAATVPCPGRDACVMAPTCPTKVYAAYAEKFGLDELTPIQASDLAVLPDGAQILSYIQERRQELATL